MATFVTPDQTIYMGPFKTRVYETYVMGGTERYIGKDDTTGMFNILGNDCVVWGCDPSITVSAGHDINVNISQGSIIHDSTYIDIQVVPPLSYPNAHLLNHTQHYLIVFTEYINYHTQEVNNLSISTGMYNIALNDWADSTVWNPQKCKIILAAIAYNAPGSYISSTRLIGESAYINESVFIEGIHYSPRGFTNMEHDLDGGEYP